jgi:hypothetical protein
MASPSAFGLQHGENAGLWVHELERICCIRARNHWSPASRCVRSAAEDLKQQLGAGLGKRHETQLVDDQQLEAGERSLEANQAPFVLGFDQLVA